MNKRIINRVVTGVIFGFISILISWALLSETSPFYQDALRPGILRGVWQIVNIPAFAVLVVSDSPMVGFVALFLQWFVIGFLIAWGIQQIRGRNRSIL
jgi:hypothetical protein